MCAEFRGREPGPSPAELHQCHWLLPRRFAVLTKQTEVDSSFDIFNSEAAATPPCLCSLRSRRRCLKELLWRELLWRSSGWRLLWGLFNFFGPLFVSFGRGVQELGTVTRIVVAGRARIVVAVAKRRTVVAFGLLCDPRVSKVSTVTGGGVLIVKLRTVVAFGLACCPCISEGLHMFFACFLLMFYFAVAL